MTTKVEMFDCEGLSQKGQNVWLQRSNSKRSKCLTAMVDFEKAEKLDVDQIK